MSTLEMICKFLQFMLNKWHSFYMPYINFPSDTNSCSDRCVPSIQACSHPMILFYLQAFQQTTRFLHALHKLSKWYQLSQRQECSSDSCTFSSNNSLLLTSLSTNDTVSLCLAKTFQATFILTAIDMFLWFVQVLVRWFPFIHKPSNKQTTLAMTGVFLWFMHILVRWFPFIYKPSNKWHSFSMPCKNFPGDTNSYSDRFIPPIHGHSFQTIPF